ncbi:MAG: hypothetical protein DWQ04_09930 [Chloroflexi bacterium]|nr:MAG: hypothetical protein DWQ04_09930 [Chloroflexota bacterium]
MDYSILDDEITIEFPPLGVFSTWFGLVLIGLTAVSNISDSWLQPAWIEPLLSGMTFILVAFILASGLFLAMRISFDLKLAAIPLVINVGTMMIVQLVPFDSLWEELRFSWHQQSYVAIVEQIQQQQIQPNLAGKALLPFRYRHLSDDAGQVWISQRDEQLFIFFPTEYAGPQAFSGFLYQADNQLPQDGEFDANWRLVEEKRPFWFFCVSHP